MREIRYTTHFNRDLKRVRKSEACTLEELRHVVDMLRADEPLPPRMNDHPLQGNWKPSRDCHVKPDLLLIYTKVPGELHLRRLASHSEPF